MGLLAAQWIVEGETQYDMFAWDMARFGSWAGKAFTKARVGDQYAHRFKIHFPGEEREAGRPVRTRPVADMQCALGAQMGLNYGWEHPLYFRRCRRYSRIHTAAMVGHRWGRGAHVA